MEPKATHQCRKLSPVKLFSVISAAEGLSVQGLVAKLPNMVIQTDSPVIIEAIFTHDRVSTTESAKAGSVW